MGDSLPARLGQNVRQLREARGLTQQQMARLAGCPRATWCHWSPAPRNPTLAVLDKVATALQVPIEELTAAPRATGRLYAKDSLRVAPAGRRQHPPAAARPDPRHGDRPHGAAGPAGASPACRTCRAPASTSPASRGEVVLAVAGDAVAAGPGDVVVFRGDQRHAYREPGPRDGGRLLGRGAGAVGRMRTIQPDELASDRAYGEWSCRGRDIWDAFCAAEKGDVAALGDVLARDPNLYRAEYWYTPPIHFAVRAGRIDTTQVLLDAGAEPAWRAMSGDDLATLARERGHDTLARLLDHESRRRQGVPKPKQPADDPIVAAAKSGELEQVRGRLAGEQNPTPDAKTSRGLALHAAARAGDRPLVELLLAHGADPNGWIDSSGSATFIAATPELRALLAAHGGRLDVYDLIFLDEDDEAVRLVTADPCAADAGCGGAFAAACTLGKRDLVVRLLAAGARVPPMLTACRSYLLSDPDLLRLLLASGHGPRPAQLASGHSRSTTSAGETGAAGQCRTARRARPYCSTPAPRSRPKDEDYRSTPLACAARNDLPDMVELLLARGAPTDLPDDEPWATPLAWATRRGHARIAEARAAGATA